jgi:hypothetical protein
MSGRRPAPRILLVLAVVTMVVSVIGFVVVLSLNAFVLDRYNAYGEVSIPGEATLHLPEGDVTISFHTQLIGGSGGQGLPIPDLHLGIDAPAGVPKVTLTENIGSTTTVNGDARVRVWVAHVAAEGDYRITTDGDVGAFLRPRLAFGHSSGQGMLPWVFAGLFGLGVVDLLIALVWSSRVRRRAVPSVGLQEPIAFSPAPSYTPTDQGVRIEALKTLAALRDSGALTQQEFEAEKRRVLGGS